LGSLGEVGGRSPKKITFIGGRRVMGKNLITGGVMELFNDLQNIPPAPPTSEKMNGP